MEERTAKQDEDGDDQESELESEPETLQRYQDAKDLTADLVARAKEAGEQGDKEQTNGDGIHVIPSEVRKDGVTKVMMLLEREYVDLLPILSTRLNSSFHSRKIHSQIRARRSSTIATRPPGSIVRLMTLMQRRPSSCPRFGLSEHMHLYLDFSERHSEVACMARWKAVVIITVKLYCFHEFQFGCDLASSLYV